MSSTRSKGGVNLTNFTDDPEKIGRNSNRRKSRNMADAGNEDPQCQQPEEKSGEWNRGWEYNSPYGDVPTWPGQHTTQSGSEKGTWLGNGGQTYGGMPKIETVLLGRHFLNPENLRTSLPTHQGWGRDITHQLLENQVPNPPFSKRPWKELNNKEQCPRIYQEKTGCKKSRPS